MQQEQLRAKELFVSYHGNTLQMYREGDLEEYKKYGIEAPLEAEWFREMVNDYTQGLSIRSWDAVHHLSQVANSYKDKSILENVISFTAKHLMSSDSIVKLMYAELIIEIIHKTKLNLSTELIHHAYRTTAIFLEDVISKPLIIDPGHELSHYNLTDKRSLNTRAKKSIEEIRRSLGG